jgi:hypothetical protein
LKKGSGYFLRGKMPGYHLQCLAAATTLHFTACHIQHPPSQKPSASIAYPGGTSQLLVKSAGAIILPCKKHPDPFVGISFLIRLKKLAFLQIHHALILSI